MGSLIGRDAERARCRAVFDSASKGKHVRAIRIAGLTGAGKTALAAAAAEDARAAGWLVAESPNFHIHATFPLFSARRAQQSLLDALGEDAGRYESGLTGDLDKPEAFAEAFLRLIEGVTLDHKLALFIDDAQWSDAESRTLIASTMTALANRPIVLLSTERSDDAVTPAFTLVDETIPIGSLTPQAAAAAVRSIYPEASDDVAQAIAQATRGHAVDLVAVATAARENEAKTAQDVSQSAARIVAQNMALLDANARTFLQVCALIEEPIELHLLQQMWPQEDVLSFTGRFSGRYLITQPDGLHFVHAAIAQSVRETIPMEIPLRFRIIEAIKKLPSPQLEDYERLAKQSAICGDRQLEHETLMKICEIAEGRGLTALAASALERAILIHPPRAESVISSYSRMNSLYALLGRETDGIRCGEQGLAEAERLGVESGLASLASVTAIAMWHAGRCGDARRLLEHFQQRTTAPNERADLLVAAIYIAVNGMESETFQDLDAEFERLRESASPLAAVRVAVSRVFFHIRSDAPNTEDFVAQFEQLLAALPPVFVTLKYSVHYFHGLYRYGVTAAQSAVADANPKNPAFMMAQPVALISKGQLHDAIDFAFDVRGSVRDPLLRRLLVGPASSALVFTGASPDDPRWLDVEADAAPFESGSQTSMLWPIVAALAFHLSRRSPKRSQHVFSSLMRAMQAPHDYSAPLWPIVLVQTAQALNDRDRLEQLAEEHGVWTDGHAWARAHSALARGMASLHLARPSAKELLATAADAFDALSAPYFAEMARRAVQPTTKAALRETPFGATTRREREVAALIADGLTNRQIAEKLVLSERTVEGHVASLFAKINVSSRTQLAAWYLRSVNSVA